MISKPGDKRRQMLHRLKVVQMAASFVVGAIALTGIAGAAHGLYRMAATVAGAAYADQCTAVVLPFRLN